jgi:PRTRC genetic system protein B
MEFHDSIGETGGTINLYKAILLYGDKQRTVATIHDIAQHGAKPVIMAGYPASMEALQSLVVSLTAGKKSSYLTPNILAASFTSIVWWVPSAVRPIWFNVGERGEGEEEKKKRAQFRLLNGKDVTHPNLVFMLRSDGLYVFAIAKDRRPTPETRLYQAPYYNVDNDGHVCQGTAQRGKLLTPAETAKHQKGFFESAFTHSNIQGGPVRYPGGHFAFWKRLISKRKKAIRAQWFKASSRYRTLSDLIDK